MAHEGPPRPAGRSSRLVPCHLPGAGPRRAGVKYGIKIPRPRNDPALHRRELSPVLNRRFSECGPGPLGVPKTLSRDLHGQNQQQSQDAVCFSTLPLVHPPWDREARSTPLSAVRADPARPAPRPGPLHPSLPCLGVWMETSLKIKICYLCNVIHL